MQYYNYWINKIAKTPKVHISEGMSKGSLGLSVNEEGVKMSPKIIDNTWYGEYHKIEGHQALYDFLYYNGAGTLELEKVSHENRKLLGC